MSDYQNHIDPALKGTTYGAALEGAARDEEAKRQRRSLEMSGAPLQQQARALANALRGRDEEPLRDAPSAPVPDRPAPMTEEDYAALLTPTQLGILVEGLTHPHFQLTRAQANQNSARLTDWGLIMPIRRGLYVITDLGLTVYTLWAAAQETDMNTETHLSETQITILKAGMQADTFVLTAKQVGRASGQLYRWEMIAKAGKTEANQQLWRLTDKGRAEWTRMKGLTMLPGGEADTQTESAHINLEDPALKPAGGFEVLHFDASPDAVARVTEENRSLIQRIKTLNKSLDDMGLLADKQTTHIKDLEARIEDLTSIKGDGRNNVGEALEYYMALIEPVIAMMERDGRTEKDLSAYVGELYETLATWRSRLIDPLADLIVTDGAAVSADDVRNDPTFMLQWATLTQRNLQYAREIADERAKGLDGKDGTIESLRRQIETFNTDLRAADYNRQAAAMNAFLVCVLDELCDLMPEVQEYREAREATQRVVMKIQARPS